MYKSAEEGVNVDKKIIRNLVYMSIFAVELSKYLIISKYFFLD